MRYAAVGSWEIPTGPPRFGSFSPVFVDAHQLIRLTEFFDIDGFKNWSHAVALRAEDRRQQTWRATAESKSFFRGEDKTNFLLIEMKTH